jgi:hypothetical protein
MLWGCIGRRDFISERGLTDWPREEGRRAEGRALCRMNIESKLKWGVVWCFHLGLECNFVSALSERLCQGQERISDRYVNPSRKTIRIQFLYSSEKYSGIIIDKKKVSLPPFRSFYPGPISRWPNKTGRVGYNYLYPFLIPQRWTENVF